MLKRVLVVAGFVAVFGGLTDVPVASKQDLPLCTLPKLGTYSPGAMVQHEGETYRCLFVYGANMELKTPGVAWVKMVRSELYVPKEPAGR